MKRRICILLILTSALFVLADNLLAQSPGNALDFDGSNDYVTIPDAAALDITDQITLEGWFKSASSSWAFKKLVTVDNNQVSVTQTDFPVLISVTDTELLDTDNGGYIQPDGDDILFLQTDGTKLSHEIDEYDGSTGKLIAWVKIPTLSSITDTEFYLYYGNTSCASQQDADNVWNANFKGVWHLEESGNGTVDEYKDGSGSGNHGQGGGGIPAQTSGGKVGNAQTFNGSNDYITMGNVLDYGKNDPMSYSAWIKTGSTWMQIAGKADESSWQGVWFYIEEGSELSFQLYDASANGKWRISTETVNDNQWHYVVATYDGSNSAAGIKLYADGALLGTSSVTDDVLGTIKNNYPFIIGATNNGSGNQFSGLIDEVRLSNTDRDSSWIRTEFRNQNSPGTFLSVGSEIFVGISKYSAYGIATDSSKAYAAINDQVLTGNLTSDDWNHIALTYNKDAGGTTEMKLYINGTESATADYSTAITSNSSDLILADMAGFAGILDELRLWNDVRTEQEIRDNMHRVVDPASANLVSYWQANDSTGTSFADSAGSNTGTLTNMTNDDWVISTAPVGGGLVNSTSGFTSGTANLGTVSLTTTDAFDNAVDLTATEIINGPNVLPSSPDSLDDRYWVVDAFGTPGTFTTNLTFTLPDGYLTPGEESNLQLYYRDSNSEGNWALAVDGAASISGNDVTFNSVSSLGQFTIAGGEAFPMPVELTSFAGTPEGENIILSWSTATEVDNYGFEVQRSITADDWEVLGFVQGHGNSNSPKEYEFIDDLSALPDRSLIDSLRYRLKQIDLDGKYEYYELHSAVDLINVTGIIDEHLPAKFELFQNYPNPFNPTTKIEYSIPKEVNSEKSIVNLKVYDILGKEVAILVNEQQAPGSYKVEWNASGFSSGIYLYKLTSNKFVYVKKMVLLR